MGNFNAKVDEDFLTVKDTIRRIDECILPDDREPVLDYIENLEGKLTDPKTKKERVSDLLENNGVRILLKLFKRMSKDELALRLIIGCFEQCEKDIPIIMEFIQFGGLELLEKANIEHEADEFLKIMVPNLLNSVLEVGAITAIQQIGHESVQLRMCRKCQEVLERASADVRSNKVIKVPSVSVRANRVLMFMENYPKRKDVQKIGLDAMYIFANNADAPSQINDTKAVILVANAFRSFKNDIDIVWRAALCLSIFATYSLEVAFEICTYDTHTIVAEVFDNYDGEFRVQQQMLWLMGNLLIFSRSKRRINASPACMELFIKLRNLRENLLKAKSNSAAEKYKPYEIVVPINVREFLRTSGGEVVEDKGPSLEKKERKKFKKRKNDSSQPKYGTVDQHFKDGEKGLV